MKENLDQIIYDNINLVYSICHDYFSNYSSQDDLYQIGVIGLIKAYKNFDFSFNVKFSTYAYKYIYGEIKKYVREDKGIKLSRNISILRLKIEKASILLSQKLMREPTIQELSLFLEIPEYAISEVYKSQELIYSIDYCDDDDNCLQDIIPSKDHDIDSSIDLKTEIEKLSTEEKKIVKMRYYDDYTQMETAKKLGISQAQVSRKEIKVLEKIKRGLAA